MNRPGAPCGLHAKSVPRTRGDEPTLAAIDAAQDAVIDMAVVATEAARRLGKPTRDPIAAIFDDRIKRQARRLLLQAAKHLSEFDALFGRQMLGLMSGYDMAGADDEALAEICDGIAEAAREEAEECRERMSDPAA